MPAGVFGVGESRVLAADLSADGSRLVTGHEDGTVWLWDTASGDRRRHASLGYPVVHCRFLPPGRRLLTTSLDQKARLWDLASPEKEPIILDQARGVESELYSVGLNALRGIAYLSKGLHRFARTNAFEGPFEHVTLRLELIGQPDTVLARYQVRRAGPDGEVLAAGDFADTTTADPLVEGLDTPAAPIWGRVWIMLEDQSIGEAEGGESRMAWDNVRVRLYPTGQPTTSWRVLDDFSSGKLRGWLHERPPAFGHRSQVENGELIMTGQRLPTGQRRGLGAAWMEPFDLVPGRTIEIEADLVTAQAPHPVAGLTVFQPELSPFEGAQGNPALHRNRLAYTWWDGTVRIWDLDHDRPVTLSSNGGLAPLTLAHDFGLSALEFSPDGRYLVSVDWAASCTVWDLATGKRVELDTDAPGRVNDARLSSDGRFLALGHRRGLALVKRDDWRLDHRLEQRADCAQPRFSPLGDRLAAVRDRHEVAVWDLGDLEAAPQVSRHAFPVQRLEFSPDGRWLAIGTGDNRVRLWDTARGSALGSTLPGTLGRFSADGETLLLAGEESGIWLWDLTGLRDETLTLPPPVAAHESWSASPDGAITAEIHGQRITLNTRRGSHSLVHPAPLRRALFSADGQHLAAEHNDSSAWVWDLETQTLAMPPRPTRYDPALESLPGIELRTENRDLQFLVDLAALLGGQRFDGQGGQQPVDDAAQASLYGELRQVRPQDFQQSVVQRQQWHQQEAIRAEQVMEWDRAVFHWERLKLAGPRLDYARTVAERQRAVIQEGGSRWSVRLPRPPWATPGMLDLSHARGQQAESPALEALPHDLFRELVGGVRRLGGVEYDVRDIIDLRRVDRVSIPVNRRCRRIHFLHASVAEARGNREPAAWYRVRYAGGATREVRLLNPEDVRPIESNPFHAFSASRPSGTAPGWRSITAWVGSDPRLERKGETLHVTSSSWVLPEEPQAEMVTVLELERASKEAASMAPLVFAITVE
jgi:WD40 repeat protein